MTLEEAEQALFNAPTTGCPRVMYIGTDQGVVALRKGCSPVLLDADLRPVREVEVNILDGEFFVR